MAPTLPYVARRVIINPADDPQFEELANALAERYDTPEELAEALREHYPRANARPRAISGEPEAWYVYREGHWVPRDSTRTH